MRSRAGIRVLVAALMSGALTLSLAGTAEARPRHHYPDQIALPTGFQPEGITIGKAPYAFLGSLADGDIYAVSLKTGKGQGGQPRAGYPVGRPEDRSSRSPLRGRWAVSHQPNRQPQVGKGDQLHPDHQGELHQ